MKDNEKIGLYKNMKLQQLLGVTRKGIDAYQMIEEGDKIAVGISGGKDSLALLAVLAKLRLFYPKKFDIVGISIDLGIGKGMKYNEIEAFCIKQDVRYYVEHTSIGKIVFDERKEKNPCSLCSKMRKGALNQKAKELGCNKVALAHHKDDFIETMLLSLIYEGKFYAFPPKTHLERVDLMVIRPMIYVNERDIIGFMNKYPLPVQKNPCPADGNTKREEMKILLRSLNQKTPGVKERMFHAIETNKIPDWFI